MPTKVVKIRRKSAGVNARRRHVLVYVITIAGINVSIDARSLQNYLQHSPDRK